METFTVGQRVALHPATDAWMQGDRFGTVAHVWSDSSGREVWAVRVVLDRSGRSLRFSPSDLSDASIAGLEGWQA